MKKRLASILALASALLLFGSIQASIAAQTPPKPAARPGVRAQPADPRETLVRKLMSLTGAGNLGKQALDAMMDQFGRMPNLPEGFADKFKAMAHPEDLVELIVPIYVKNYDMETLQAAVDFYDSDAGHRFSAKQGAVLSESQRAGQKWGMELSQKVLSQLQSEDRGNR